MTRTRRAAILGGLLASACQPAAAIAPDRAYALGAGGWSIELFGADVAVLSARLTAISENAVSRGSAPTGLLALSCDGPERRLRLIFPDRIGSGTASAGAMLLRALRDGARPGEAVSARIAIADGRALALSETARSRASVVLSVARLLKAMPGRLDLLVSLRPAPVSLSRLTPYVIRPSFRAGDALAVEQFLLACARPMRG